MVDGRPWSSKACRGTVLDSYPDVTRLAETWNSLDTAAGAVRFGTEGSEAWRAVALAKAASILSPRPIIRKKAGVPQGLRPFVFIGINSVWSPGAVYLRV